MSKVVDEIGFSPDEASAAQWPGRLFQPRQLWALLLRSGTHCDGHRWRTWADARIGADTAEVPSWGLALSTAATRDQANGALGEDIGLDIAKYHGQVFEGDALTIGFVFARHLDGELTRDEMWAELRQTVDIAEFIDRGKWRRWHGIHSEDSEDPLAVDAGWLRHLAWLAVRRENDLLRDADNPRPEPCRTA